MPRPARPWVWVVVVVLVFTGIQAVLNSLFDDFKGEGVTYSRSTSEARFRGILVTELVADPQELEIAGGRIRFGEAWIEEEALSTHQLVWLPAERRTGDYRLYFTLADVNGVNAFDLIFASGDLPSDAWTSSVNGRTIYSLSVGSPDVSGFRMSVIRAWSEPRAKNIRFVPKG